MELLVGTSQSQTSSSGTFAKYTENLPRNVIYSGLDGRN